MHKPDPRTPVIIGVGQCVDHMTSGADLPSPQSLRALAARRAMDDSGVAGALAGVIDRVVAVRTMLDSVPGIPQPFGRCANPPATLAAAVGVMARELIYSAVGGDQPQTLVNESAAALYRGDCTAVLLAGAEATAAMKAALKSGQALDWSASAPGDPDDRGMGPRLLSAYDLANGLGAPTQTYPAFENALAARMGHDVGKHRVVMSALWAGFSEAAAANPYAQFPTARSAEFLSTPSAANYPVAEPYLKWDVAQDAVNQGAAVVLTTLATAQQIGVAADKIVYLHGHAAAVDKSPSERPDLSRSRAIELVVARTLESSDLADASAIAHFDLYSCFPVAVLLAAEALALDWGRRAGGGASLTVTGGLPFFGGAGNNYSMHAIAAMVERLRGDPGAFGLVGANGGFLSKESAGIYSTTPPAAWQPVDCRDIQAACDAQVGPPLLSAACTGTVESWSVTYAKGVAQRGYAFLRTDAGERALARTAKGDAPKLAALAADHGATLVGQRLSCTHEDGVNILTL